MQLHAASSRGATDHRVSSIRQSTLDQIGPGANVQNALRQMPSGQRQLWNRLDQHERRLAIGIADGEASHRQFEILSQQLFVILFLDWSALAVNHDQLVAVRILPPEANCHVLLPLVR